MVNTKRFKRRASTDLYEVEVHASGRIAFQFVNKYRKGNTQKFKGDLAAHFQILTEDYISVWKSDFSECLFGIFDDTVLIEVIRQYNSLFAGVFLGFKDNGNFDYTITFALFLPNLPQKYIIAETPKTKKETPSKKASISKNNAIDRFDVRIPVDERISKFIDDEVEFFRQTGNQRSFSLSASFLETKQIILSDQETDGFLLSFANEDLYSYLETFGKVEANLDSFDIDELSIICHFLVAKPRIKPLSFSKLKREETGSVLSCSELQVAVLFNTMQGKSRLLNITKGRLGTIVVGSRYIPNYSDFEKNIKESEWVILKKEPTNPVNPEAIAVFWNDKHIGYIPEDDLPFVSLNIGDQSVAVVKENNLGWISIEMDVHIFRLLDEKGNKKFGPFTYKIMKNHQVIKIDYNQLYQLFRF